MGTSSLSKIVLGIGLCIFNTNAQCDPDFGIDFVTISDPGNRHTTLEETERPFYEGFHVGRVEYEFRIAKLELSTREYFEFVEAYLPIYMEHNNTDSGRIEFTGRGIAISNGIASIREGYANRAATMWWEYAARYVNWLHNGKINEEWAFESGVYETSTFTRNDDGTYNHQGSHNIGARYWLPTRDEWIKAAYWDPNMLNGEGGYWQYQNSSHVEPIPAILPSDGGERNAGPSSEGWPLDVGSFPDVTSPWGLLDMSGGVAEYTETAEPLDLQNRRLVHGTSYWDFNYGDPFNNDLLGRADSTSGSGGSSVGIRLASTLYQSSDLNQDGVVNYFDISMFIRLFASADERVDFRRDGRFDLDDVRVFLGFVSSP